MAIIKKDLQALNRDIKALEKKMANLIAAAEKSEKATTIKRAPSKKAPCKKEKPHSRRQPIKCSILSKDPRKGLIPPH